jgi:hypothetical protein
MYEYLTVLDQTKTCEVNKSYRTKYKKRCFVLNDFLFLRSLNVCVGYLVPFKIKKKNNSRDLRQLNPCATVFFSLKLHILTVSLKRTNCGRCLTHTMAVLTFIS